MTQEEAKAQLGYNPQLGQPITQSIVQQHTKEFNLPALNDQQLQEQISTFKNLLDQRRDVPGDAAAINAHLGDLQQEVQNRQVKQNQTDQTNQMNAILGQGGQTINDFRQDDPQSRAALENIFNSGMTEGTNQINRNFANQRGQAVDEAAASGLLRQPGFLTHGLANIDAQKESALDSLFNTNQNQRAQGQLGLENELYNRAQTGLNNQRTFNLSRAGMNQAGNQFQQTQGLAQDQFANERNQQTMQDIFNNNALTQAGQVGRMQADAMKPTAIGQVSSILGGIGGLAGGLGGLAGGLGKGLIDALGKPKKPEPAVYGN